jgi:hypothetical protein
LPTPVLRIKAVFGKGRIPYGEQIPRYQYFAPSPPYAVQEGALAGGRMDIPPIDSSGFYATFISEFRVLIGRPEFGCQ